MLLPTALVLSLGVTTGFSQPLHDSVTTAPEEVVAGCYDLGRSTPAFFPQGYNKHPRMVEFLINEGERVPCTEESVLQRKEEAATIEATLEEFAENCIQMVINNVDLPFGQEALVVLRAEQACSEQIEQHRQRYEPELRMPIQAREFYEAQQAQAPQ